MVREKEADDGSAGDAGGGRQAGRAREALPAGRVGLLRGGSQTLAFEIPSQFGLERSPPRRGQPEDGVREEPDQQLTDHTGSLPFHAGTLVLPVYDRTRSM